VTGEVAKSIKYRLNYVQAITYPWVLTPTDYTYEMGYFKNISLKVTFLK